MFCRHTWTSLHHACRCVPKRGQENEPIPIPTGPQSEILSQSQQTHSESWSQGRESDWMRRDTPEGLKQTTLAMAPRTSPDQLHICKYLYKGYLQNTQESRILRATSLLSHCLGHPLQNYNLRQASIQVCRCESQKKQPHSYSAPPCQQDIRPGYPGTRQDAAWLRRPFGDKRSRPGEGDTKYQISTKREWTAH